MYKDKDKQREANRKAKQRQRAKCGIDDIPPSKREQDLITKGMTKQGMTVTSSPSNVIPKRGKDIKCFADLPPDVQETINAMSMDCDPVVEAQNKAMRTVIALGYQHLYPDRYYSTGM